MVTIASLEASPEFQALDYAGQQRVRNGYFQEVVAADPQFQALDMQGKSSIYQRIMSRAPVLRTGESSAQELINLTEQIKAGDTSAVQRARGEYVKQSLVDNSGVAGLLIRSFHETFREDPLTIEERQDRGRAFQYLDEQMKRVDPTFASTIDLVVPTGLTIADIAVGRLAAGAVLKGAKTLGGAVGKSAAWLDDLMGAYGTAGRAQAGRAIYRGSNRVLQWATSSVLPQMIESGYDATVLTLRNMAQAKTNELNYGVIPEYTFKKIAQTWGQEFAVDLAFWAMLKVSGNTIKGMKASLSPLLMRTTASDIMGKNTQEMVDNLRAGISMTQDQIAALPDEAKRTLMREVGLLNLSREIPRWDTEEAVFETVFAAKGETLQKIGDRFRVLDIDNEVVGTYPSLREAVEDSIRKWENRVGLPSKEAVPGDARRFEITEIVDATVKQANLTGPSEYQGVLDRLVGADTAIRLGDEVPAEAIQQTFKELSGNNLDDLIRVQTVSNLEFRTSVANGTALEVMPYGKTLKVPQTLDSPETMRMFGESLSDAISQAGLSAPSRVRYRNYVKGIRSVTDLDFQRGAVDFYSNQLKQIDPEAKMTFKSDGTVDLNFQGQLTNHADTRGAMYSVFTRNIDKFDTKFETVDQFLKEAFAYNKLNLERQGEHLVVRSKSRIIAQADSYEQLFRDRPDLIPQLPDSLAPRMVSFTPYVDGGAKIEIRGPAYIADLRRVKELQANYFNTDDLDNLITINSEGDRIGHLLEFNRRTRQYEVSLPEFGVKRRFADLDAAKAWAKQIPTDWADLQGVAGLKGIEVDNIAGTLLARQAGERHFKEFTSLDGLRKYIAEAPIQGKVGQEFLGQNAVSLRSALPEEYQRMLNIEELSDDMTLGSDFDFAKQFEELTIVKNYKKDRSPFQNFGFIGGHSRHQMDELARTIDRPDFYEAVYQGPAKAYHHYTAAVKQADFPVNAIFNKVPRARRKALLPLFQIDITDEARVARIMEKNGLGVLSGTERAMLEESRQLIQGLSRIFGVDYDVMLSNYMPRIKRFMKEVEWDPTETLGAYLGRNRMAEVPREMMSPEFLNMRMKDVAEFAYSTDPKDLINVYIHKGYKDLYIKPAYEKARAWMDANLDAFAGREADIQYVVQYMERIIGYEKDYIQTQMTQASRDMVSEFNKHMSKALKLDTADARAVHDITDVLTDLAVMNMMAARPWLPIRNLQQVWTVLGTVLEPGEVTRAMKQLHGLNVHKAFKEAITAGRLKTALTPVGELTSKYSTAVAGGHVLDAIRSLNTTLMKGYQNSDTWTRMVSQVASGNVWDDAYELLRSGEIDLEGFLRRSKLENLSLSDQQSIVRLMQNNPRGAKEQFIDTVTDMSLFSYRKTDNPAMWGGFFGKLFGKFGHYPVSYLNTLQELTTRKFRNNPGLAIMNMLRIGMTTGIAMFAASQMGIRSSNFTPWGQAIFTGGPWFDALDGIREGLSYAGSDQKRALTTVGKSLADVLTPVQTKAMGDAIELFNSGDSYGGWLKLMSFPYMGFDGIQR